MNHTAFDVSHFQKCRGQHLESTVYIKHFALIYNSVERQMDKCVDIILPSTNIPLNAFLKVLKRVVPTIIL